MMKLRKLSQEESVKWVIFLSSDSPTGAKVISQIKDWGIDFTEILDDAITFDSEKEALEMKEMLDGKYPMIDDYGYVDCVLCKFDK